MLWLFVEKIEGGKQLHFSKFDENFHDLIGKIVHSSIDSCNSRFYILGPKLFKGWP
jgi:hypothetical protein